jgi:imidazoleglycerol phosphate synthase glutamine amidotransferase subunit HisH
MGEVLDNILQSLQKEVSVVPQMKWNEVDICTASCLWVGSYSYCVQVVHQLCLCVFCGSLLQSL